MKDMRVARRGAGAQAFHPLPGVPPSQPLSG